MNTLVVIPLYNEETTVGEVLVELQEYHSGDVLVVDDGSTDSSLDVVFALNLSSVKVLRHTSNKGYGRSIIDGFQYAMDQGYDGVLTMDADGQHMAHWIEEFVEDLKSVDIVSGSRYLESSGYHSEAPADRRHINQKMSCLIRKITDYPVTDSFCGFKAYRVDSLRSLTLSEPGYAMPMQFWVQAFLGGLTFRERPVARIYQSHQRYFGDNLDDPDVRWNHYVEVLARELTENAISLDLQHLIDQCEEPIALS